MGLVLQLVETRADSGMRSVELMEFGRPRNFRTPPISEHSRTPRA